MTCAIPKYEFIQTVKSKNPSNKNITPGILIIENSFTFHFNKWSKDGLQGYYQCSVRKQTGCTASCIITKILSEDVKDEATGEFAVRHILSKWSEVRGHNHEGDQGKVIVDRIIMEMAEKVEINFLLLYFSHRIMLLFFQSNHT